jgi:hypothetical protein
MILVSTLLVSNLTAAPVDLGSLEPGSTFDGFRAEAVYVNDADEPFGARFVHENTGFTRRRRPDGRGGSVGNAEGARTPDRDPGEHAGEGCGGEGDSSERAAREEAFDGT